MPRPPLRQIIRDTKRTDFYLDAEKAKEYGLIDEILGPLDAVRPADETLAAEATGPVAVPPRESQSQVAEEEKAPAARAANVVS